MKKIIFTLLGMLMITSASAASQTTFMPVLSEGKSWEVATISWDYENFPNSNDTTGYYAVSVCGDTIVNNLTCKKIEIVPNGNQKSSKTAVAYEKDGKVWNVNSNGEMVLIFDIGLHQNGGVGAGYVVKEDYISVNGLNRKRLLIDSGIDSDDYCYYVVEGIGISSDKWVSNLGVGNENEYTIMLSCSENGEIVFTKEDFSKQDDYVPLVREGVVWEYVGYYHAWPEPGYERIQLYTLEFNGTTVIDGKTYYNIYRTYYDQQGNAKEPYLAAYVREEGKVVTAIENDVHGESINDFFWWDIPETLYDFNKPMFLPDDAEYAEINYPISEYSMADTYQEFEVEIGQTIRKGYQIIAYDEPNNPEYSFKTIEGIGVDCGFGDLLVPYRTYITGINSMSGLSAVYENGELVYMGCKYDEAQELKQPDAITTISGEKQAKSIRYYNLAGVESAEPQQGVNIKVTTYSDGTRSSEKVIK